MLLPGAVDWWRLLGAKFVKFVKLSYVVGWGSARLLRCCMHRLRVELVVGRFFPEVSVAGNSRPAAALEDGDSKRLTHWLTATGVLGSFARKAMRVIRAASSDCSPVPLGGLSEGRSTVQPQCASKVDA